MGLVDRVIARLAARQYGAVARWQLRALGVTDAAIARRVRDGSLVRVHHGVYVTGNAPITERTRWMAAALACGEEAAIGHTDAVALWDLPCPRRRSIHVTAPGASGRRRRLIIHRTATWHSEDRQVLDGIPVTSLPRTLLDFPDVASPAPATARLRSRPLVSLTYRQVTRDGPVVIATLERLLTPGRDALPRPT